MRFASYGVPPLETFYPFTRADTSAYHACIDSAFGLEEPFSIRDLQSIRPRDDGTTGRGSVFER